MINQLTLLTGIWAPAGGGGNKSRRSPPSLLENQENKFSTILGAFLILFLHVGLFCYVISLCFLLILYGCLFPVGGLFGTFFLHVWAFLNIFFSMVRAFFRLPLPYENFCRRPCTCKYKFVKLYLKYWRLHQHIH